MSVWSFQHSVEAAVAPDTAWRFWTTVSNWTFDTSLEWVTLEPAFVTGAKGVTKPRGADPVAWSVRDVADGHATIEMTFPGAVVAFHWSFLPTTPGCTRITQHVTLSGPQAGDYIGLAESQLARGIPEGMRRLAKVIEERHRG
ncbi:MAG TPA: SRPBCC family protein [Terriglobia bacterium]|nr:SRPBCC family protein [Terriglobia bacterium]